MNLGWNCDRECHIVLKSHQHCMRDIFFSHCMTKGELISLKSLLKRWAVQTIEKWAKDLSLPFTVKEIQWSRSVICRKISSSFIIEGMPVKGRCHFFSPSRLADIKSLEIITYLDKAMVGSNACRHISYCSLPVEIVCLLRVHILIVS